MVPWLTYKYRDNALKQHSTTQQTAYGCASSSWVRAEDPGKDRGLEFGVGGLGFRV